MIKSLYKISWCTTLFIKINREGENEYSVEHNSLWETLESRRDYTTFGRIMIK